MKKIVNVLVGCIALAIVFGVSLFVSKQVSADVVYTGNVHITEDTVESERIYVEGNVILSVDKGVTLEAKQGITVEGDNSLTIDGKGKIIATGNVKEYEAATAGIGSYDGPCGTIIIKDGIVEATGGHSDFNGGPGIGIVNKYTGVEEPSGNIIIMGGQVIAKGASGGDGSGEGSLGGAGIGGGNGASVRSISITGGEVEAFPGFCAAAIGHGNDENPVYESLTINISGGSVNAHGNIGGAKYYGEGTYGDPVYINITGGNVVAKSIGHGWSLKDTEITEVNLGWTNSYSSIKSKIGPLTKLTVNNGFYRSGDNTFTTLNKEQIMELDGETTIVPRLPVVTFDPNGGRVSPQKLMTQGENGKFTLKNLPKPTRRGLSFDCWVDKKGKRVTTWIPFSADTTVTARWKKVGATKDKIKLKLKKLKKIKKSKKKKITLKATLKINGKTVKGKKITFKFKKKKYNAKTNKKGVAKVKIKRKVIKKLKVGKKVKYQAKYKNVKVKRKVKVKK